MQAWPGFMSLLPWFPCVHVTLLVQVGADANGSSMGTPASIDTPPSGHELAGVPADTQAESVAMSALDSRVSGAGGMGFALSCTRASASAALLFVGSVIAGAVT